MKNPADETPLWQIEAHGNTMLARLTISSPTTATTPPPTDGSKHVAVATSTASTSSWQEFQLAISAQDMRDCRFGQQQSAAQKIHASLRACVLLDGIHRIRALGGAAKLNLR